MDIQDTELKTESTKIKVGFISAEDPTDKRSWSGTIHQLYNFYFVNWSNRIVQG
ncbi:MAG: hypothetical protein RL662_724 [Bacteroidota bacterium]|jgi:hypothetical protein